MPYSDVAFTVTGDLHRNIRALKQLRSLSEGGYSVRAFHLGGAAPGTQLPDGVEQTLIDNPPGSGPLYFWRVHLAFKQALLDHKSRLYHASDLYSLSACHTAALKSGSKYSFDSRELYAHVAATASRPWAGWFWSRLERRLLPGAASIFTVSRSIADALSARYGIPGPTVVENVPEDLEPEPSPSIMDMLTSEGFHDEMPVIVHLGQMKKDRGCELLIRAMQRIPGARLVFLGYGPLQDRLRMLSEQLQLNDRVHFYAPVRPRAVQNALSGVTLGVTLLEDTCLNHRYALPNKLFDYMRAGIPILGSNLHEVTQIIEQHGLGMTANPSKVEDVARVANLMLESDRLAEWAQNAVLASETFRWDKASQRFMMEMHRVLGTPDGIDRI